MKIYKRRHVIRGATAIAIGAAAGVAAACSGDGESSESSQTTSSGAGASSDTSSQPKRGGEMRYASSQNPPSLDLQKTYSYSMTKIAGLVYNRLIKWKAGPGVESEDRTIVEDLATTWEQPDPQTFIFKLRPGVKWHNVAPMSGRTLVADDIKYSFERILDPATNAPYRFYYEPIDSITVTDQSTVTMKLKFPFGPFLDYLANYYTGWIFPREAIEQFGDLRDKAIGTGPYLLESFQPNVSWRLKRNPDYFLTPQPYLDNWTTFYISDPASSFARLMSKQLDFGAVSAQNLDTFQRANPRAQIAEYFQTLVWSLMLSARNPKLQDVRVRQAFTHALDRQPMIDNAYGGDAVPTGIISRSVGAVALSEDDARRVHWVYDPQKARQLLSAAGHGANALEVDVALSSNFATGGLGDVQTIIVEQLNQAGIRARTVTPDFAAASQQLASHNFDCYIQATLSPEPDEMAYNLTPQGPRNFMGFDDAEINRLVEQQRRTTDDQERISIFRQIEERVAEAVPLIPTVLSRSRIGVHDYVRDWAYHLDFSDQHINSLAWLDK